MQTGLNKPKLQSLENKVFEFGVPSQHPRPLKIKTLVFFYFSIPAEELATNGYNIASKYTNKKQNV